MEEKVDPDIGRVVGFQTGDLMYIATIISIDDDADQFTVRTEDGQELTGPFGAVFLDPEKRMDELNEHYESLGDGTFREKPRTPRSNWTPVADPSPGIIAFSAASIVGIAVLFLMVFILFNLITTSVFCKNVQGDIRKTIVIVCSLKTLPSAVMVIQKMQEIIPTLSGVALIPCMMFHIIQTLVISAFASNNKMSSRLV